MGIRDRADVFAAHGYLDHAEARRFNTHVDDAIENGQFLYTVTYLLTSATVPAIRS